MNFFRRTMYWKNMNMSMNPITFSSDNEYAWYIQTYWSDKNRNLIL